MATIGVGSGSFIRPHRNGALRSFPVGASQTFKKGDPIKLQTTADKGNQVIVAAADPTGLVGFAAEDAPSVENTKMLVYIADEDTEFVGHVADGQALDADDIGDNYGLVADSTNSIWRVDRTETTTVQCKVVELLDPVGDINGRVAFKVLNAARQVHAS